jgi:hypothetical protein
LCNNTIASRYYNLERQNSVSLCRKFWQSPFMRGFQISILTSSDFPPAVYACFMRETGAWNGNSIIITSCYWKPLNCNAGEENHTAHGVWCHAYGKLTASGGTIQILESDYNLIPPIMLTTTLLKL